MRKYLLCFFVSCIIATVTFAQSCGVGNPIISNASTYSTADSCYAIFDLTVGLKANGGNKFVGISLWMASTYQQPTYAKVPDETDLSKALGTIVIDNNNSSLTPQLLNVFTSYPYVQGNTNQNVRILRSNGLVNRTYKAATDSFYFNISNIIIAAKRVTPTSCTV